MTTYIMRDTDKIDTEEINRQRTKEIYRRRKLAMLERIQQNDAEVSKSVYVSVAIKFACLLHRFFHLVCRITINTASKKLECAPQ